MGQSYQPCCLSTIEVCVAGVRRAYHLCCALAFTWAMWKGLFCEHEHQTSVEVLIELHEQTEPMMVTLPPARLHLLLWV